MGVMTLEQFRADLLFDLKNRTDTSTTLGLDTTRQDRFINAGYYHVTHPSIFRHRELQVQVQIALVSGTGSYTFSPLAATFYRGIRYLTHLASTTITDTAQKTKLLPHDEQWFMARTLTSGGPPRDYAVRAGQILVSPVPGVNENGQLLLFGSFQIPAALAAGQQTVLPPEWDEIVLLAARWRAELHLGYRDLAEATKLDFVSLINEYKDFEQLHGEDWDWQSDLVSQSVMETA